MLTASLPAGALAASTIAARQISSHFATTAGFLPSSHARSIIRCASIDRSSCAAHAVACCKSRSSTDPLAGFAVWLSTAHRRATSIRTEGNCSSAAAASGNPKRLNTKFSDSLPAGTKIEIGSGSALLQSRIFRQIALAASPGKKPKSTRSTAPAGSLRRSRDFRIRTAAR